MNFKDQPDLKSIKEFSSSWLGPGSREQYLLSLQNKNSYYDNEGYLITDDVKDEKIINKKINFNYKLNKHGFRSNHFKLVDSSKTTILTAGCSQSFGQALPEELRWQSFLLKNLKNNNIDFFDVSSTAASIRLITRNTVSFIRNYGKPNYIFIVFPDIARDFMFFEKENKFNNVNANTRHIIEQKIKNLPNALIDYTITFNEYDALMKSVEQIWHLEELCKLSGIKLFWTSWEDGFHNEFFKLNFNNFVEQTTPNHLNINNLEYWDMANDKKHFGSKWTSWQGKIFSEKLLND
jgi:hypothetical protein